MSGSNTILSDSVILKETLMRLKNSLVFTKNVSAEYGEEFAQKGAKKGDTVNIRKPVRYETTTGVTLNIQDTEETSIPLVVDKQYHVGMAFTQKDRALSIDKFAERYIDPAVEQLGGTIDANFYSDMYKAVFHSVGVPSATALPSTLNGFVQAKAKIAKAGGPKGVYSAVVDPLVEASMVDGLKGLFQSADKIAEQYESGMMGMAGGCKFMMSQSVANHTVGALGGTPVMNGTTAAGAQTLVTNGWTSSVANRLKKGDVITVDGVYAVNPITRQSTGQLAQFAVTADTSSDGSGNLTIPIDRAIYASGKNQNVDALPLTSAAIKIFGHASSYASVVCPQNLVFHKSAFAFASVDYELPDEGVKATRAVDKESGLSLTMTSQFDIVNYRNIRRIDFLGGWKCIYPELAARVVGQPA
jgi:hypothetical protein